MTPGIKEGGKRQDAVRDIWRKQVESEERLSFFKKMVGREINVRELQHIGMELHNKFRSEDMKLGESEKEVVKMMMRLKLRDERKTQRELKRERDIEKKHLEEELSKAE